MRCELKMSTYTYIMIGWARPAGHAGSGCNYGAEVTSQPVTTNYKPLIMHTLGSDYNVSLQRTLFLYKKYMSIPLR